MDYDIIIAGGGPAGLSLARAMAGSGFNIALIERQERQVLANPDYDGREIALTHKSIRALTDLGAWARIPVTEMAPLVEARVLNGASPIALTFNTDGHPETNLGMLVSNHLIRRTLFESTEGQDNLEVITGVEIISASSTPAGASVILSNGKHLSAPLLVAADSRFSAIRRQLGINAEMNRLGTAMLVCRVEHERDHRQIATEWFGHGQTFAMLPLNRRQSSAVLTLPLDEAKRLAELDDEALGVELSARYHYRLGSMRVVSSRHVYPLVTTLADRFAIAGAALIGDTAVGMHPVTAHGFNLGLASAMTLAEEIRQARRLGESWHSTSVLSRYERRHRRAALPLYRATAMIVRLYSDERPPAWLARHAAVRLGRRLPLLRGAVTSMLLRA